MDNVNPIKEQENFGDIENLFKDWDRFEIIDTNDGKPLLQLIQFAGEQNDGEVQRSIISLHDLIQLAHDQRDQIGKLEYKIEGLENH